MNCRRDLGQLGCSNFQEKRQFDLIIDDVFVGYARSVKKPRPEDQAETHCVAEESTESSCFGDIPQFWELL